MVSVIAVFGVGVSSLQFKRVFCIVVGNEFSPSASLNDYLRQTGISTGTKVFCRQGGCGVCIVVAKMTANPEGAPVIANLNSVWCNSRAFMYS